MRRFASKLLAIGGITDEGYDWSAYQDTIKLIPKTSSARERLDDPGVSRFRIHPRNIKFTSTDSHGSGGGADVTQAKFRRTFWGIEQLVAVKKLRTINELIHEVEVLAALSHKNIVKVIGFVEDLEKEIAWLVLSWESNGNISDFLAKADWKIPERVSLIQDTFEAIRYLHTCQPPICHGDLKSRNILVNSSYRAILTDFGSARAVIESEDGVIDDDDGHQMPEGATTAQAGRPIHITAAGNQLNLTGPAWSLSWASPEVVNGKRPSLSSDIWAAGWVSWELMTNKTPFPEVEPSGDITMMVIQARVPSSHEEAQLAPIVALCSLMTDCWAFNPRARPDISRCCNELNWMSSGPPSGPRAASVRLLLQMGQVQCKQTSYDEAASLYQQALSLATSEGNQTGAATALMFLGDVYRFRSNHGQAEELYIQAQEIYTRIGHDLGRANTLDGLGHLYRSQSKYIQAKYSFTQAQEIYSHIGDDLARASTFTQLGDVNRLQSEYSQAEASFISAERIYSRLGDNRGLAKVLRGLGEVYLLQSKYADAEEAFTRAQQTYTRIGDDQGRANTFYELGRTRRYQSRYPEAEELYTRAQAIYANVGCVQGQGNTLFALGDLYLFQCKYTQAEEWFSRAQEIYTNDCHVLGRANAIYAMGLVRHNQERSIEAATYYVEARNLYTQLGRSDMSERVSRWLADVSPDQNSSTTSPHVPVASDISSTNLPGETISQNF
ncbi:hypothetical protein M407DRAFT_28326 [Tulasnella calospora MUT 4182]|uniref:Protein kinase domain-containing protein n=1 Tax=Tulasnella calospora MUT 4182 TaxID=1051891 RepID=A0A0C3QAV7_9AGAM|nr:hypothetical protein M407DRAFT_28326 [Tulasnella calospora MUT 4182]